MTNITIHIQPPLKKIQVILSPQILFSDAIVSEIRPLASRCALFCDDEVEQLFGSKWKDFLQSKGIEVFLFSFPPGEKEKNRERKAELEDLLFSQKFNRDTCMIALGGGVTTDLIGFLASTFCRGVPLVYVPTTLLAMVDAAIGGKTGINTRFGKNLIGTFYPANKVFVDPALLISLPRSEWTNGLAEIIKYSLIYSPELFEQLKGWIPEQSAYLEQVILTCIQIKAQIIEADYQEIAGLRRILNFGHTIAHSLELIENYQISHGEAVAIGMIVESRLSVKMGLLSLKEFEAIDSLIRSFPFALKISPAVTLENIYRSFLLDKKTSGNSVRFVLLEKIGSCASFAGQYCTEIPAPLLDETLHWMMNLFREKI